jgi:TolB-like protein
MNGFFEELKRRKVYRVAIAYIVAGWALAQGLAQVLPVFEISNSVIRVVIALLLIGFPLALVLAWVFDMTPQGIKATPSVAAGGHRRRNVLMLAAAGVVVSIAAGFFVLPRAAARKIDKSIAVLPFENLSDEKENAYFADGIQDDILTNLSKIGDLKVISRTSVMSYRGHTPNVRDIGKALGVSTILEGSVRRAGNRVRVNVQLIDATTDEHLWANDYDRDLTDVFAIQTDLAQKIANELQAKLSPIEKARIENKPTQNNEAYLAFVEGHDLFTRPDKFQNETLKAEQLFEKATKLDPNFALAFACLGWAEDWIYHSYDPTPVRKEKARSAIETAIRLQPDLPEAHMALGFYHYYCERDYQKALDEFAIAKKSLPNDAGVYLATGAIERRQGKWDDSTANLERAAVLNPKDSFLLVNLADNYRANRDFEKANQVYERAVAASPNSFQARAMKAYLAVDLKGDFGEMEKELAKVPAGMDPEGMVTLGRAKILMMQRKFPEALALLKQYPEEVIHDSVAPVPKVFLEGILYTYLGDKEKARAAFEKARPAAEQSLRESPDGPDSAGRHALLGQIFAGLGQKNAAIAEGKRAVELLPESQDAFDGPSCTLSLAQIYAWTGEHDQAIQLLDRSLNTPNGVSVPLLKLDPVWDPLRKDPRFQALIDKYGAKV